MSKKILIPIAGDEVAPRFDLAAEVHIVTGLKSGETEDKTVVLPQASAEKLCHLILTENISCVICGAIEEEYFEFLSWKKITVIDAVAGSWEKALILHLKGDLSSGEILCDRSVEGRHVDHP
ncbi:hypothetical protein [Desulfoluna sp.]|uniref:NifB/NifX family molybdenum-iron cluster-binding protein n=1 Tax=Desulfoluna sp. TaxID=2045199 RepID=UPI00262F639B|nr:hypothetical protein [Desulfoluna sp.]